MKLGVIVPYRGSTTHLRKFKESITGYLDKSNISYHLIVVVEISPLYTPYRITFVFSYIMLYNKRFYYVSHKPKES